MVLNVPNGTEDIPYGTEDNPLCTVLIWLKLSFPGWFKFDRSLAIAPDLVTAF